VLQEEGLTLVLVPSDDNDSIEDQSVVRLCVDRTSRYQQPSFTSGGLFIFVI
jgi:hypothetical protein